MHIHQLGPLRSARRVGVSSQLLVQFEVRLVLPLEVFGQADPLFEGKHGRRGGAGGGGVIAVGRDVTVAFAAAVGSGRGVPRGERRVDGCGDLAHFRSGGLCVRIRRETLLGLALERLGRGGCCGAGAGRGGRASVRGGCGGSVAIWVGRLDSGEVVVDVGVDIVGLALERTVRVEC